MIIEPYSDDYMRYDKTDNRYVLTEKALLERVGVDLRARMASTSTASPEIVINAFTRRISDMIYTYIHNFSADNAGQDRLITVLPKLRRLLQRAMEIQALYVLTVGDLFLSTKPEERENAVDRLAQDVLGTVIPELGSSILYCGVY